VSGVYRPDQSQGTHGVQISKELLREIAAEVLRVQRSLPHYGDPTGFGGADFVAAMPALIPAVVLTSISQGSGTTPGTGTVQLYYLPDGATAASANPDDGASVTAYNWYTTSGTVAAGKHCFVGVFSGVYWLMLWEC
jgi:hypothetical protein